MGRSASSVNPQRSEGFPEGEFTSPEDFNRLGVPQKAGFLWERAGAYAYRSGQGLPDGEDGLLIKEKA